MKRKILSIVLAILTLFTCSIFFACTNENGLFVVKNIQYEQPSHLIPSPDQDGNAGSIIIGGDVEYCGKYSFDIVGKGEEAALYTVTVQCAIYCNGNLQEVYTHTYLLHGNERFTVNGSGGSMTNKNDKITMKIVKITWI